MRWLIKFVFVLVLTVGLENLFAQTIDRSQYEGTTLFDYQLWEKKQGSHVPARKFKATVYFYAITGTLMAFTDEAGTRDVMSLNINRRWPTINRGQRVTIYFTAAYGRPTIDDMDFGASSGTDARPWQQYIDDGKTGKSGWYLKSLGNGRYEEVYY